MFFLKQNVCFQKIQEQLKMNFIKQRIFDLQNLDEKEICSDLPNAFWNRKWHLVDLPYKLSFDEKNIPTKARPIQMNAELEHHFRKEIPGLRI